MCGYAEGLLWNILCKTHSYMLNKTKNLIIEVRYFMTFCCTLSIEDSCRLETLMLIDIKVHVSHTPHARPSSTFPSSYWQYAHSCFATKGENFVSNFIYSVMNNDLRVLLTAKKEGCFQSRIQHSKRDIRSYCLL